MTVWNSTCNPCFSTFDQIVFVFHGLKTGFFCYSLKLNFICYPNRFFTYDYSLLDRGDIRFCGQKQTLIKLCLLLFSQTHDLPYSRQAHSNHYTTDVAPWQLEANTKQRKSDIDSFKYLYTSTVFI